MASLREEDNMTDIDTLTVPLTTDANGGSENDMILLNPVQCQIQDDSEYTSSDSASSPRKPSLPKSKAKKARKAAHQTQSSKPSLRPAKDILSRIRHDPALDESEYIVGYHDRHLDVMEMDVSSWKGGGDSTDEEWIPQHRILYFRKKGEEDDRRIWDRATRLDRLFGSGIAADLRMPDVPESNPEVEDTVDGQGEPAINEELSDDHQKVIPPGDEVGDKPPSLSS